MNTLNRYFAFLQLLMQLLSVASYTVVLKQVKPFHPSVKVYRYELRHAKVLPESNGQYIYSKPLLGQKIYPVVAKPGRDFHLKTRVPVKNEKGKFFKVSSSTEKPILRDPRLLGLSQHLVPPVSNQIEEYSEAKEDEIREEENDIRPLVNLPHASQSFSSFGQEKGRIYNNPGDWATPAPQANSENASKAEFTPSQLYLQIRHKNTVIHVPQSEALRDAETLEELINAPRLKELSRTTHVQETYSEEGYEDAGYDHAGHVRQAQHGEVYDAKDEGKFRIKEAPTILDYDSDLEESQKVPLKNANDNLLVAEGNLSNKIEPRITRSRSETSKTSLEYAKTPKNYKGGHKYSSRVKSQVRNYDEKKNQFNSTNMNNFPSAPATFPTYFDAVPPAPESIIANESVSSYKTPIKVSSKYRKDDFNSTKIYPVSESTPSDILSPVKEYTDFKPFISLIDSQASPSAKSLKYSRIYSKKTKQLRLEPYKNENIYSPPPPPSSPLLKLELLHGDLQASNAQEETADEDLINQRIVLPTIGYINSLTTAHFGNGSSKPEQEEFKSQLTGALNLTQALNYLRSNKNQQNLEVTKSPTEIDIRTFEPMKLKKFRPDARGFANKTKRDVYLVGMGEKRIDKNKEEEYEGNDDSDLPHNEKNKEIEKDERMRIEEENREKEKYEEDLTSEISKHEEKIVKETLKNIGVEDDISEIFPEFSSSNSDSYSSTVLLETTPTPVNTRKYPFYMSKRLPENSALRYATDPKQFPRKSGHKMEFYESREQLIRCPDFHPDLQDLPNSNSTEYSDEQAGENQRLTGLGDKIACLRMKYFDPEPFDNPIFKEKEIEYVGKPSKGQKKVKTKLLPNTLKLNKEEEKLQQTSRQKSYEKNLKNQKFNKKLNNSDLNMSSVSNHAGQNYQDIKNQSTNILKVFTQSKLPLKGKKTGNFQRVEGNRVNELPLQAAKILQNTSFPSPPTGWKTIYGLKQVSKPETRDRIVKSDDCLPRISQLMVFDGTKNVTVDCNDVILIQDFIGNVPYIKIIPKEKNKAKKSVKEKWERKTSSQSLSHQSDWVPIVGYTLPYSVKGSRKPFSRRTDEATNLKNETRQNTGPAHYVIDELKEDENVRKGEVVEDSAHYLTLMEDFKEETKEVTTVRTNLKAENSTRKKREAQNEYVRPKKLNDFTKVLEFSFDKPLQIQTSSKSETDKSPNKPSIVRSKAFELKRPLTRLSGLDFLVRYHKTKSKPTAQKAKDFWKISTQRPATDENVNKSQRKSGEISTHTISRNTEDKSNKTIFLQTKKTTSKEIKEVSAFRKRQIKSPSEKFVKPRNKQSNDYRKISPSNLIPEKLTKTPENRTSEIWKMSTQNSVSEETTTKPTNFTKIITKVSTETSETNEKPRFVLKQATLNLNYSSSSSSAQVETPPAKPEFLQYKTINRNSTFPPNKDSENLSRSNENPEEPTLYYVVNLRTGRGQWITNYDEKLWSLKKHQKPQKVKEISGTKKDKRRKKLET